MKKIKVLHIAFNDMGHGGIQACIMTVAEQLKDRYSAVSLPIMMKPFQNTEILFAVLIMKERIA